MPKMKSHSGAKKRFRFTSTGKVKSKHSHKNHILTKKKSDRIRKLKGTHVVSEPDQRRIHIMLPNVRTLEQSLAQNVDSKPAAVVTAS